MDAPASGTGPILSIFRITLSRQLRSRRAAFFVAMTTLPVLWSVYLAVQPELLIDRMPTPTLGAVQAIEHVRAPSSAGANAYGWMFLHMYLQCAAMVIGIFFGTGGASLAGEAERGTLSLFLSRPIARWQYYLGRRLALDATVLLLTAPPLVACFLLLAGPGGERFVLYGSLGLLGLSVLAFDSIVTLFGLFRWSLAGALGWAFLWELANAQIGLGGDRSRLLTLGHYQRALTMRIMNDARMGPTAAADPAFAVGVLLAVGLVGAAVVVLVFGRREMRSLP